MKFLNKFENINIDKFNTFTKKYKKSQYISSKSKEVLGDIKFLQYEDVISKIDYCKELLSKLDLDLLDEIIFDFKYDYFDLIDYKIFNKNNVNSPYSLNPFNIYLSWDKKEKISEFKIFPFSLEDNSVEILDTIINKINTKIAIDREDIEEKSGKKPRDRWYYNWKMSDLRKMENLDNINIKPCLSFFITYKKDNRYGLSDEYIKSIKEDIVERFLKSMNITNDYKLITDTYSSGYNHDDINYNTYKVNLIFNID